MTDPDLVWEKLSSKAGPAVPLFRVRIDRMRHPAGREIRDCLVLESPDWVNVVAVTAQQRVVMVEQYRFGAEQIGLEPPAGIVEAGEPPLSAARRELLEETGFGGGQWRYLGRVQPNPAFQDNVCHHWLAENVEQLQPPQPDPGEAIRVRLMTPDALRAEVAAGRLGHVLAQSALSRVFPLWQPGPPGEISGLE